MAAKVKFDRGAWWVFTHYQGKRKKKRIGPTKANKREAEQIARKINAALALGTFSTEQRRTLPCDAEIRRWHTAYAPTMKLSYRLSTESLIRIHLVPFFGSKDLRELREVDLLAFVRRKLEDGLAPRTIRNALAIVRRVLHLAQREGLVDRNPAARIGELMRRVGRQAATETEEAQFWRREEANRLIELARIHEPGFAPILVFFFSTGARRGEALGLRWEDVDFEGRSIRIRRSITRGKVTTPKSGRGRTVAMPHSLAETLFDLLAVRRRDAMGREWGDVPKYVFCSEAGAPLDSSNLSRAWNRLRRRAQTKGIRPLKLHSTRHTWATLALASGKSIRWVADQLGHADPAMTLRVYAHVLHEEEADLSFAEFGDPKRPYTAPRDEAESEEVANYPKTLAPPGGLEPPAYGLGNCCRGPVGAPGGPRGRPTWQSLAKRVLAGPRGSSRRSSRASVLRRWCMNRRLEVIRRPSPRDVRGGWATISA